MSRSPAARCGGSGDRGLLIVRKEPRWLLAVTDGSDHVSVFQVRRNDLQDCTDCAEAWASSTLSARTAAIIHTRLFTDASSSENAARTTSWPAPSI